MPLADDTLELAENRAAGDLHLIWFLICQWGAILSPPPPPPPQQAQHTNLALCAFPGQWEIGDEGWLLLVSCTVSGAFISASVMMTIHRYLVN